MGIELKDKSGSKMIVKKFRGLLNEQNIDLWNDLNQVFNIELEESQEESYLTYFDEGVVVIEIDKENQIPAAFTHELLHVFLKAKGVQIIWDFKEKINKDKELGELFSTSLRVHIGNCLEHVKILPLFLSRGFINEDFITDYKKKIMDREQMWDLEQSFYRNGKPELGKVDRFMGKFFAMKASNNPDFDYSIFFERFEKLDGTLFKVNNDFWEAWMKFKIDDPREKYIPFLNEYLEDIKEWKMGKGKGP